MMLRSEKHNISLISDKYMCSGCGACLAICPKNAVTFSKTSIGRFYAKVNNICVNCGLCLSVCPSVSMNKYQNEYYSCDKLNLITAKSSSLSRYHNGQSGGAVTSVLAYLFRERKIDAALICRPIKNGYGEPIIVTNEQELEFCQKSVYTPVPMLKELRHLKSYKSVAVVGLPCHIAGLNNIIDYLVLPVKYKLGLICDGNMCGVVSEALLHFFNVDNVTIKWKDKSVMGFSYLNAPVSVTCQNGNTFILHKHARLKLKNIFTPIRCLVCPDKVNIFADLVFGDPWNLPIDEDFGESLIIANTCVGEQLLNDCLSNNSLILTKQYDCSVLNKSQNLLGRQERVELYAYLVGNRKFKSRLKYKEVIAGVIRLLRLYLFEHLPKSIVISYTTRLIRRINNIA